MITAKLAWNCADRDLRLAELRLVTGVDDVGHHRHLTATTELR